MDPAGPEALAEKTPSSGLWPALPRARITRTLVDLDTTRLNGDNPAAEAPPVQQLLTAAQALLTFSVPEPEEGLRSSNCARSCAPLGPCCARPIRS